MSIKSDKIKKNITTSVMLNIFNIIINFIGRIIFLKVLDVYFLSINGLFTNILGLLSLADMGVSTAMMYSMYGPISENNTDKITSLVTFFKKIYFRIAIAVSVVGLALTPFIKYIINMDREIPYLYLYYILSLISVVITYLFIYRTILINADQKQYILNKIQFNYKLIGFISQIFILLTFKNYALYMFTLIVVNLLSNFAQNNKAMELYPYLKENCQKLSKDEKKEIGENVKSLFIYKFCGTLQDNMDNILISVYVGTIYVGIYSNYLLVTLQVTTLISVVFASIKASVGNVVAKKIESEKQEELFWKIEAYNYWLVGFCSVSLYVLLQDFIGLVFGKDYLLSSLTVIIIVSLFYTKNIRQTIWTFRETTGMFRKTKYISLISSLLNLVLSIILGRQYGLPGILLASIIAIILTTWWLEPIILFKDIFDKKASRYFLTYINRVIYFICVLVCTNIVADLAVINQPIINFVYKMFCCLILTNLLFALTFLKKEYIFKMIKN